jgi:hypothetical protein
MIVFVSWSKDSQKAAEGFCDWLPKVIQQVKVWHSGHIESGAKWFTTLSESLSAIDFGVLMVSKKNYKEPWLQFEAGALAKAVHSKVTPVFCNLSPLDVVHTPLVHLQGVKVNRDDFWKLISDVNPTCAKPLGQTILKDSFDLRWPEFEKAFKAIEFESEAEAGAVDTQTERIARIEDVLEAMLRSSNNAAETLNTLLRLSLHQIHRGQTATPTELGLAVGSGFGTVGVAGTSFGSPVGSASGVAPGTPEPWRGVKSPDLKDYLAGPGRKKPK